MNGSIKGLRIINIVCFSGNLSMMNFDSSFPLFSQIRKPTSIIRILKKKKFVQKK